MWQAAIIWIVNTITGLGKVVGILAFCASLVAEVVVETAIVGAIFAAGGLVFGIWACAYDIPPRWNWALSKTAIFDNVVGIVFGYVLNFFFTGCILGFYLTF